MIIFMFYDIMYLIKKEGISMSEIERIVNEVDSSMAMEGFVLNPDDKNRIVNCLKEPESLEAVIESLVNKHKMSVN